MGRVPDCWPELAVWCLWLCHGKRTICTLNSDCQSTGFTPASGEILLKGETLKTEAGWSSGMDEYSPWGWHWVRGVNIKCYTSYISTCGDIKYVPFAFQLCCVTFIFPQSLSKTLFNILEIGKSVVIHIFITFIYYPIIVFLLLHTFIQKRLSQLK